ncbi:MAG: hypothetical protein M1828_005863 [Chrysothrix sp. TS-e1954]|nr:MAG: hypothetical protein M1828_005863 [Chrysothrix sp. TS-e1954]
MSADHNVSALLAQQQHQVPSLAVQGGAIDNLTCQWLGCTERAETPEHLYDHVCERHVGRKSTNNLNLQCQWGACRTTTVKRDHITSHIRVHVPLKPHKCEFCGKSFKRPQDLKKHVKTHADDSILLRSPDNGMSRGPGQMDGYQQSQSKGQGMYPVAPTGQYYMQPPNGYEQQAVGMQQNPYAHNGMMQGFHQAASYGDQGLTEMRKRNHDELNQFFGAAKTNQIDPYQYIDLASQLGGPEALPFGMGGGYQTNFSGGGYDGSGVRDFGDGTAAYAHSQAMPQLGGQYGQPFASLKTRDDLLTIDRFLEQLQNTAYDYNNHAYNRTTVPVAPQFNMSSEGPFMGQGKAPQASMVDPDISDSPPNTVTDSEPPSDTPALTPHSNARDSPTSVHSGQVSYPFLNPVSNPPTVASMSAQFQNRPYTGSGAGITPSGLANPYEEAEGRRRFSGGYLQRARPDALSPQNDIKRAVEEDEPANSVKTEKVVEPSRPEGEGSPQDSGSPKSNTSSDKEAALESWVQNMRVLESLRQYVQGRLENQIYGESESESASRDGASTPKASARDRDVDGDSEMKEREEQAVHGQENGSESRKGNLYPVLGASAQAT